MKYTRQNFCGQIGNYFIQRTFRVAARFSMCVNMLLMAFRVKGRSDTGSKTVAGPREKYLPSVTYIQGLEFTCEYSEICPLQKLIRIR